MIVLNSRSVLLSPVPARPVNCGTETLIDTDTGDIMVQTGCGAGNCKVAKDICQAQGTYMQYTRNIVDDAGNAVDVSANTITFTIFQSVTGNTLLNKTTADGSVLRPTSTSIQWEIDSAESLALPTGARYYEIWLTDTAGERRLAAYGRFLVQDTRKHDA